MNAQFSTLSASSPCKDGDQACVKGGFAQCVGGKFAITPCSGGTQCFALPLVNKAGTSITCSTNADAQTRIAATGATGGIEGTGGANSPSANAPPASNSNVGSNSADDGSGSNNADDQSGDDQSGNDQSGDDQSGDDQSGDNQSGDDQSGNNGSAPPPASTPAPAPAPAPPANAKPFTLQNGKDAQALNAKFAKLTADSQCKAGDQACVNGGFAQCVGGKFAITACSGGTKCFALPLVNKAGTSVTCSTDADASARIAATGATGGIQG